MTTYRPPYHRLDTPGMEKIGAKARRDFARWQAREQEAKQMGERYAARIRQGRAAGFGWGRIVLRLLADIAVETRAQKRRYSARRLPGPRPR